MSEKAPVPVAVASSVEVAEDVKVPEDCVLQPRLKKSLNNLEGFVQHLPLHQRVVVFDF